MASAHMQTHSSLTCPVCGHAELLEMPTASCQFFHECSACHAVLRPLPGDCCVFCSFGSVKCPPVQDRESCCHPAAEKT